MLRIPTKGISRSVRKHNIELDILCDWIEGSILFDEDELSFSDIVDILCEELIYDEQSFAFEIVQDGWYELRRRRFCIPKTAPFLIENGRIQKVREWREVPAHSFCVLLALTTCYCGWSSQFGSDYTEQGELFEELTKESLERQFTDWNVLRTGWSRSGPKKLTDIIDEITSKLGELKGDPETWAEPQAHDDGLDLLWYRPFGDNRVGIPLYLIQCASGSDWEEKLKTPDIEDWCRYIHFAARPNKGFAIPFALLDAPFRRYCGRAKGMLLDRYRLLAAANNDWVSLSLKDRLIAWMDPRVLKLPRYDK
jgi:hypothetical protein